MAWVQVIQLDACRLNAGTFVTVDDRELAVFRFAGPDRVIVIDNACPHAGGNLSGGEVVDGVVACPWHDWQFDLATGVCIHSADARVRVYPSEIRDGSVWVELPESGARAAACGKGSM